MSRTDQRSRRILACVLVLSAAAVSCERPSSEPDQVVVPVPPGTRDEIQGQAAAEAPRAFATEAAAVGLAQIEAARLAAMRTSNPAIKAFAEQMERDHAALHDTLQQLARDKGIDLPSTVAGTMRTTLDELAAEIGSAFDRRYLADLGVDAHLKAIERFERQAAAGQDAEFRDLAGHALPMLRDHARSAQRLLGQEA